MQQSPPASNTTRPLPDDRSSQSLGTAELHLRLLETTDVHSNLMPFDYYSNGPDTGFSLARAATLIANARSEAANSLLFDNGDFLQGTPISDMTAQPGSGWNGAHPTLTAMNSLGYDAATLGNHEFNFGLDWLTQTLAHADFPVVCANIQPCGGKPWALIPRYVIRKRNFVDTDGNRQRLRIGIIGFVPPQITTWDQQHLGGRLTSRDIIKTAETLVPKIRADGADLVIALAHTGIDPSPPEAMMENAALPLAQVPGIDAILAGHSHQVFPDPEFDGMPGVDTATGSLHGVPAVMAGSRGSHLGVIDLTLHRDPDTQRWHVLRHSSEARPVKRAAGAAPVLPDSQLCETLGAAHRQTLRLTEQPIGRTQTPLHSYLALIRNDPATQLVMDAQRDALERRLDGTAHQGLPILSASAPFKTGGRAGPAYFTDVPAGQLHLRNAADLYTFPNTLCGLRLNGAQLRDWLERAAICFSQVTPGQHDQPLLNPKVPGHDFDVISGLTYQIDLSQPARYDLTGQLRHPEAHRIRELCFDGAPLDDDALFIVASNNYRAYGGGPFLALAETCLVHRGRIPIREHIARHIQKHSPLIGTSRHIWQFAPCPDTSVIYPTGPGVRSYLDDLAAVGAEDLGDDSTGFACLRLQL